LILKQKYDIEKLKKTEIFLKNRNIFKKQKYYFTYFLLRVLAL